jgi:hypothetical protein
VIRRLKARSELRRDYGPGIADELYTAGAQAAAKAGIATEEAIERITTRTANLQSTLKSVGKEDTFNDLLADMLQALDTGADPRVIGGRTIVGGSVDDTLDYWSTVLTEGQLEDATKLLEELSAQQIPDVGLPRQRLHSANKAANRFGPRSQRDLDEIAPRSGSFDSRGGVAKANKEAVERLNREASRLNLRKVEQAVETDITRLTALNTIQANRAMSASDMIDNMTKIFVDPETQTPLVFMGTGRQARELAEAANYKPFKFGNRTVHAPAQIGEELKRFQDVVFSNPGQVEDFKQGYDKWLNLWKGSATVPILFGTAFHARNMTGNIFNNWLAGGITIKHYRQGKQYQRAIKTVQNRMAGSRHNPTAIDRVIGRGAIDDVAQPKRIHRALGVKSGDSRPRTALGDTQGFVDELRKAAPEFGLDETDIQNILNMRDEGVITSGFFRTDLHEDAAGGIGSSEAKGRIRAVIDDPQTNMLIRSGSALGHAVETNARIAHYLGKIDQGLSPSGAMLSVKKHLFDYADLTQFERRVLRRVIPFYTFMRFNTPLQFQNMITQPRKLLNAQRAQEAVAALGGGDFSEGKALNAWALDRGDTPLSGTLSQFLAGGEDPVLFGLELPSAAAIEAIEPFVLIAAAAIPGMDRILPEADDPTDGFRALVNLPGGAGIEYAKVMVEEALNEDLFTGAPVDQRNLLRTLAGASVPLTDKGMSLWEDITTDSADLEGNRIRVRILKSIFGVNLTVVDPRRQRAEMFRELELLDLAIDNAKAQGIDVPTVTELRDAGLIPTIKQLNAADRNGQGPSQIEVPPSVTGETNRLGLRQRSPA